MSHSRAPLVFGHSGRMLGSEIKLRRLLQRELDDISGNGQTGAAHGLCTGIPAKKREHYLAPGVGHYGIFSGRRFREMLYPRIRDFIRRHA